MTRSWQIGFGIVLTAIAGFVDAIGFIRLGGLYTSLMSGNTTQLAVAIGRLEPGTALLPGLLILAFFVGAVIGGALSALTPVRWATPAMLAYEAVTVLIAFRVGATDPNIGLASLLLAHAMGAQNAVLAQVQGFRAGTTFVTGALFAFGQKLALALAGRGARFGWAGDGAVWFALMIGAVAGTVAYAQAEVNALAIPGVIAALLAVIATVLTLRRRPEHTARSAPICHEDDHTDPSV